MGTSRLGNLLVEEGLLTETDRRTIKRECGTQGAAFAKSIVALGLLDEDELAAFLAERTSHPVAPKDLASVTSNAALGVVDRPLIERLEVVPLDFKNNTLSVAMADPLDQDALAQLSFFTGYRIRPVIATFKQIQSSLVGILPNFQPQRSTFEEFLRNHVLAASSHMKAQDSNAGNMATFGEPEVDFDDPIVSPDPAVLSDDDFADDIDFAADPAPPGLGEKDSYGDFADARTEDLDDEDASTGEEMSFSDDDAGFADDDIETDLSEDMASETIIDEETDASFAEPDAAALPQIETESDEESPSTLTSGDDIDALFSDPSDEGEDANSDDLPSSLSDDISVDSGAAGAISDDIAVEDITGDLADELSANAEATETAGAPADDDIFAQASAELEAEGELPAKDSEAVTAEPAVAGSDDNDADDSDPDIFAEASAEFAAAEEIPKATSDLVIDDEGADSDDLFAAASAELATAGELPSDADDSKPAPSATNEDDLFDQVSAEMEAADDDTPTPQEPSAPEAAQATAPEATAAAAPTDEPAPIADLDEFDMDGDEVELPASEPESSAQDDVDALLAESDPLESFASSRAEVDDTIEAEPVVDDEIDDVVDEFEAAAIEETDAALASFANTDSGLTDVSPSETSGEASSEAEPPADFSDFDLDDGDLDGLDDAACEPEQAEETRTTDSLDDLLPAEDIDELDLESVAAEENEPAPAAATPAEPTAAPTQTAPAVTPMSPQEKIQATSGLNRALISLALVKDRPRAAEAVIKALRGAGFQRGVLLDSKANFLCEWQDDDPVQFEPQATDYQSAGLTSALGRLSEEWSDFTATTRDDNLSTFDGWPATLVACRVSQTGVACIASREAGLPDSSLAKLATQVLKQASHHF